MKKEWKPFTDEEREVIRRYEQWQALNPEERKRRLQESERQAEQAGDGAQDTRQQVTD